jgi:hypothetical protein
MFAIDDAEATITTSIKVASTATLLIVDTVALKRRGNKEITSTLLASL